MLWAVEGYYFVTFAAGEVRDPTRNLPRALGLGLLTVMAVYVIVNLAYLYALPMESLRGTTRVAEAAATAMVGPAGATIIALTVLVSTLGSDTAVILFSSRLCYAMASDGVLFPAAAAVHPKYRTPHVAIVGLTVWSSLLALTGTYRRSLHLCRVRLGALQPARRAGVLPAAPDPPERGTPVPHLGLSGGADRCSSSARSSW